MNDSEKQGGDEEARVEPGADLAPGPVASSEAKEDRNWALAAHLTSFSYFVGIPGFVGPLVIWLVKKDELPFTATEAKESLNFQISLFIYAVLCVVLTLTIFGAVIGIPGLMVLALLQIIFPIMGAIKANEGKSYRYPITIRLVA